MFYGSVFIISLFQQPPYQFSVCTQGGFLMNCYVHPDNEAIGTCTSCGRPTCRECAVEMENKLVCRECLSTGKARLLSQTSSTTHPVKDRSIALILEILPGLFGFIGFGWIYSGNTGIGIAWLLAVLFWNLIAFFIITLTAGFGCFITVPINIVLVAVSASSLNSYTKQHHELFSV
jgi:hypothetical protein